MRAAPSYPHSGGRIFEPMTRTRTRTYGVATPSTRQPLLEAMLRAFCWLVSNVVSTCRTIFNRRNRDWHTDETHEDQLPTPSDLTEETRQAAPTGLSTGSGPRAASSREARVRNGAEGAIWSGGPNRVTEAASYARGLQTPHTVRTRKLSLRSSRRMSASRADGEPCPTLQLQAYTRVQTVPGFRRLILSLSKHAGVSGLCCAKSA
jgi:hypothetical protein